LASQGVQKHQPELDENGSPILPSRRQKKNERQFTDDFSYGEGTHDVKMHSGALNIFNREIQKAGPSRKRDLLDLNNLGTGKEDELLLQSHKTIV